jgi:hypothetical protein
MILRRNCPGGGRSRALLSTSALTLALLAPLAVVQAQDATPAASPVAGGVVATYALPDVPLAEVEGTLSIADDHGIFLGGIGSDLWHDPSAPGDEFWVITDRGPNSEVEIDGETRRTFPVPDFTPLILHLKAENGTLSILEVIPLTTSDGASVTGLSNLAGPDEAPFDFTGTELVPYNEAGLDTEGMVRTSDGGFWLAEEYRPSVLKVAPDGEVLARYIPEGEALPNAGYPVEATLPAIYGERRSNRGFEGLAISGDESTLYALLQSPLNNPDQDTGAASHNGRILAIDAATGRPTAEYVYPFEPVATFDPEQDADDQGQMKLSGIVWLDDQTLLVLERTDPVARLYAVDLAGATNVLGTAWDDPATTPSLEATTDLAAAGVTPLSKTLWLDLEAVPGMPDKIEGVALVDDATVAVINDNDFAIGEFDDAGRHIGTRVPSTLFILQAPGS